MSKTAWIVVAVVILVVGLIVVVIVLKPNQNEAAINALGQSYLENEAIFQESPNTTNSGLGNLVSGIGSLFKKK